MSYIYKMYSQNDFIVLYDLIKYVSNLSLTYLNK